LRHVRVGRYGRRLTLVLFDVDGTLLLTPDRVYLDALVESVRDVWGHELTEESFGRAEHRPGETAMQGLRHLLLGEGLERAAIDRELRRWCTIFAERYVALLARTPTPHWELGPATLETLAALEPEHTLALLTGNPEPVARARMERLGLNGFFPPGAGAFGCEAEERADLIDLARDRAGASEAETVLVGDTPLDIAGAHEAGIRAVAVTTGEYGAAALAAADAVVEGLRDLPGALSALGG
jgi:phosphoglycolate phosphatase-like HAD superfamily hydrolase